MQVSEMNHRFQIFDLAFFWQFWPKSALFFILSSLIGLSRTKSTSFPYSKLLFSIHLTLFNLSFHFQFLSLLIISHVPSWWLQIPCRWPLWALRWVLFLFIGLTNMVQCSTSHSLLWWLAFLLGLYPVFCH